MNTNTPEQPAVVGRFTFEPMQNASSPIAIIEALLKTPGRLIYNLERSWRAPTALALVLFAIIAMAAYGIVVGTFAGGVQIWIAPAKVALGAVAAALICLPSLYIFTCLGGVDAQLRTVTGVLFAAIALSALLLIGFAPVAWIFSQSTDSIGVIATLHIILWLIAIGFGLRIISAANRWLSGTRRSHTTIWSCIFVFVCLQMMTTLRPIVGKSDRFLPTEKKFFLAHWFDTLNQK
ncbi:MAG: hypothetical protein ACJ8IQ_02405 [Chthoniobacterales bacterium]